MLPGARQAKNKRRDLPPINDSSEHVYVHVAYTLDVAGLLESRREISERGEHVDSGHFRVVDSRVVLVDVGGTRHVSGSRF